MTTGDPPDEDPSGITLGEEPETGASGITPEEVAPTAASRSEPQQAPSRVPQRPWRDSANQDYWLLTQSMADWLHPIELLGAVGSFAELRASMAACGDYLSKEAARGSPTPDRILRSERFQACARLGEKEFQAELTSWRWHRKDWFALKQVIEGACADGIITPGERRFILERSRACGFADKEILDWIKVTWPDLQEAPVVQGEILLRRTFSEQIADCAAFVAYVTSSSGRWSEAVKKRSELTLIAPNLAGEDGRRFERAVEAARVAVQSFVATCALTADPGRDDALWLLAVLWGVGTWGAPTLRVPLAWQGEWVRTPADLLRIVDARPKALEACQRDFYLAFWLCQDNRNRPLGVRLTRKGERLDTAIWHALWELGETRIRVADTAISSDLELLAMLNAGLSAAESSDLDRLFNNQILDPWATRIGSTALQAAIGRARANPNRSLRNKILAWSLGSPDLVPGIPDVHALAEASVSEPARVVGLIRDGSLEAWLAVRGTPKRVTTSPDWSEALLISTWLRELGVGQPLRVGSGTYKTVEEIVAALSMGGPGATLLMIGLLDRLRDGTLDAWLPHLDPPAKSGGLEGVHERLWRLGFKGLFDPPDLWIIDDTSLVEQARTHTSALGVLIASGALAGWVRATGRPVPETPKGADPIRTVHAWLWALGARVLLVAGRSFKSPSELFDILNAGDPTATILLEMLATGEHLTLLPDWLESPKPEERRGLFTLPVAKSASQGAYADRGIVLQALRSKGFGLFYDHRCGWIRTPRELAEWVDAAGLDAASRERFRDLVTSPNLHGWLAACHPRAMEVVRQQEALLKVPIGPGPGPAYRVRAQTDPIEIILRAWGLAAPVAEISESRVDFGTIGTGTRATRRLAITNLGPRGILTVWVDLRYSPAARSDRDFLEVQPGAAAEVEIRVDVTRMATGGNHAQAAVRIVIDGAEHLLPLAYKVRWTPSSIAIAATLAGLAVGMVGGSVGFVVHAVSVARQHHAERDAGIARLEGSVQGARWEEATAISSELVPMVPGFDTEQAGRYKQLCHDAFDGQIKDLNGQNRFYGAFDAAAVAPTICGDPDWTASIAAAYRDVLVEEGKAEDTGKPEQMPTVWNALMVAAFEAVAASSGHREAGRYWLTLPGIRDSHRDLANDLLMQVGGVLDVTGASQTEGTLKKFKIFDDWMRVTVTARQMGWYPGDRVTVEVGYSIEDRNGYGVSCTPMLTVSEQTLKVAGVESGPPCPSNGEDMVLTPPKTIIFGYALKKGHHYNVLSSPIRFDPGNGLDPFDFKSGVYRSLPPGVKVPLEVPEFKVQSRYPPSDRVVSVIKEGNRIDQADLTGQGCDFLWIARNWIYARHGYSFTTDRGAYFKSQPDYQRNISVNADTIGEYLTAEDRANADILVAAEKKQRCK